MLLPYYLYLLFNIINIYIFFIRRKQSEYIDYGF